MSEADPRIALVVRENRGQPFYEAKFRHEGRQVKRRVGAAWLQRDGSGWTPRKGRLREGFHDVRSAHIAAAEIARSYIADMGEQDRIERERRARGVTFREIARDYLAWLADVAGAKPSTLRDHRSVLAEPGVAYKRGVGETAGHVMALLGDRPAAKVTTREVNEVLARVAAAGASPRTVNKYRAVIAAAFNYASKPSTYNLTSNPAQLSDRRRQPTPSALVFYSPEEVESIARACQTGMHRERSRAVSEQEKRAEDAEHAQDAELVRVAAYAGLRLGELLALRWEDVDFAGSALTIGRAMSAGVLSSTKSGKVRRVPLADQAAVALDRLSRREHYTSRTDLVFCNALGRALDGSALRRRYRRAQKAAGARPLRFHDLRHTFGSLLAANGIDVVSIQDAMGHADITTTRRYLHARPASEQAQAFTRAFEPAVQASGALESVS